MDAPLLSVRRNVAVAANALLSMMQSKGEVSRVHIGGSGSAVARLVFQDTSMQHVLLPCACNKCTAFVTCRLISAVSGREMREEEDASEG